MSLYRLPKNITIAGKTHKLRDDGDYRIILEDVFPVLEEKTNESILVAIHFWLAYDNWRETVQEIGSDNIEQAYVALKQFINCNQPESSTPNTVKLIDWQQDGNIICSEISGAMNLQTDVRELEYVHWFTFMGAYCRLGEGLLSTICAIRKKLNSGKKLEPHENEFLRNNREMVHFQKEIQEQDDILNTIWNQ